MKQFKGTKGEWVFDDLTMKIKGSGDVEGKTIIANVSPKMNYSRGMITQSQNAKLIAAAPELLKALQDVLEHEKDYANVTSLSVSTRSKIENTINKAL